MEEKIRQLLEKAGEKAFASEEALREEAKKTGTVR